MSWTSVVIGLFLTFSAALFVGCSPVASTDNSTVLTDAAGTEIIGGFPATPAQPGFASIVMILGPSEGDPKQGSANFSTCTGVLIDENIALTAAHCLKPLEKHLADFHDGRIPDLGTVTFAADSNQSRRITKFIVHENYVGQKWVRVANGYVPRVDHDLGLVFFEGRRPSNSRLAKITSSKASQVAQRPVRIYGYGINALDKQSLMKRDRTTGLGRDFLKTAIPLLTVSVKTKLQPVLGNGFIIDQRNKPGICYGDSGGPAFQGEGADSVLVALHSHRTGLYKDDQGQEPLEAGITHECQYFSMMTPVQDRQDWIRKNVANLQTDRCENQPLFQRRVADLFQLDKARMQIRHKGAGLYAASEIVAGQVRAQFEFQSDRYCMLPTSQGPLAQLTSDRRLQSKPLENARQQLQKNPEASALKIFTVKDRSLRNHQLTEANMLMALTALSGKTLQKDSSTIFPIAKGDDGRAWIQAKPSADISSQPLLDLFQIENADLEKILTNAIAINLKLRWAAYGLIGLRGSQHEIWFTDPQTQETVVVQQTLFY